MKHALASVVVSLALTAVAGCGGGDTSAPDASRPPLDGAVSTVRDAAHDASERASDAASDHAVPHTDGSPKPGDAATDTATPPLDAKAHAPDAVTHPLDAAPHDAGPGVVGPYGVAGPSAVTTATLQVTSPTDTFSTTAYIPGGAGPHPVVILSSGFEQTGAGYAPYAERLASWGIVTLLRDDPGIFSSLTAASLASDIAYEVTTYLSSANADATNALHGKVDVTKIGLAGHSRGGQVALLAGEGGAKGKVLGVFGLDPVDTATNNVEARTTIGSIDVPVAFIGETTDSTGGVGGMPCAPAADNYLVLYQAASSPAVAITALNADHTMFEDPSACTGCTLCTAGTANQANVLAASVRYMTAFFARTLQGDASVGVAFTGAGVDQDVASGLVTISSK